MHIRKTIVLASILAFVHLAMGQTQDLFRVTFRANCRALGDRGRLIHTRFTDQDIVAQCVGTNVSSVALTQNFALVYNATADRIQVVSVTNGLALCDVLEFQGGALATDTRQSERFTFLFVPEETNAVGSAVISERLPRQAQGNNLNRARIGARFQLAVTDDTLLGRIPGR